MHALGFNICELAADPQEAFLLAMGDQPDVVLMDVCLKGGREGIEAARWLREVSDVPIVFVTVLPKPVYRDRLADALAEASKH
jgi:two-component system, response regulator PdtaR